MSRGTIVIWLLFFLALPTLAAAQDVQRIAAIVNDEVISGYDVEQRINLVLASTQLRDAPEVRRRLRRQVLLRLVDERLQLQEAARYNIAVTEEDLERAYRYMESQNNLPPGKFDEFLRRSGISRAAMENQLRAEIAWTKLIQRRFSPNVRIGDDEIDETIDRLKGSATKPSYNISEIVLPIDSPEQEEEVRRSAVRLLQEIRGGANFAAMAQQFSRGATAQDGGAVGWVQAGQLASEVAETVPTLSPGSVSDVIRAPGGFYLIKLHERRDPKAEAEAVRLTMKQMLLPIGSEADAATIEDRRQIAAGARERTRGCDQVEPTAKELGIEQYGDLGTLLISDMPENIRAAVRDLEIGRLSQPIETENGLLLIMICEREKQEQESPDRERIRERLTQEKLAVLAQRYMRDLRRAAVVELR